MDPNVLIEIAKAVAPFLALGTLAVALLWRGLPRRPGPLTEEPRAHRATGVAVGLVVALAGVAAVWLNTGRLLPGAATVSWIGVLALAAGLMPAAAAAAGIKGAAWEVVKIVTLTGAGYIVMRRAQSEPGFVFVLVGFPVVSLLALKGLERATSAPGWSGPAAMLIAGFAVSQALVIGTSSHTPAWMAAGLSALMGVALVTGLLRPGFALGVAGTAAPGTLLCGLMLLGAQWGNVKPWQAGVFCSLLLAAAVAPLVVDAALGTRSRPLFRVLALGGLSLAAVAAAAVLRPPPIDY